MKHHKYDKNKPPLIHPDKQDAAENLIICFCIGLVLMAGALAFHFLT